MSARAERVDDSRKCVHGSVITPHRSGGSVYGAHGGFHVGELDPDSVMRQPLVVEEEAVYAGEPLARELQSATRSHTVFARCWEPKVEERWKGHRRG